MADMDRTLVRNGITQFIIKVDLAPNSDIDFPDLANSLSTFFDRIEKREHTNFAVNLDGIDIQAETGVNYVLTKEDLSASLTISKPQNVIIWESRKYLNNVQYRELFERIVAYLREKAPQTRTQRIGMRFVNQFRCGSTKEVNKIFESQRAKSISVMVSSNDISRVIAQEEFNYTDSKLRVQYGIPNKFYPAVLNNYDLLLDIDAIDDSQQPVDNWGVVLRTLNHHAYDAFIRYINPKYLEESLK